MHLERPLFGWEPQKMAGEVREQLHQSMCCTVYLFSLLPVVGVHKAPTQDSWLFGARLRMVKGPNL